MKTAKTHSNLDIKSTPVHGGKKLHARWTNSIEEDMAPVKKPTRFERIRYNIYDKIPTSCMCREVHPIWKHVKKAFVFIFGKPDTVGIIEYDLISKLSKSIQEKIDNDILSYVSKLNDTDGVANE